jgi:hypothetical protein
MGILIGHTTKASRLLLIAAVALSCAGLPIDRASAANGSVVYTYDALGRLKSASYDTGVIVIYTYDSNGNRLSQTINVNTTAGTWGSFSWGSAQW